jgi:hypothetical protein
MRKFQLGRKKGIQPFSETGTGDPDDLANWLLANPTTVDANRPMQSIAGMVGPNPQMPAPNRGEEWDGTPITFNRFGTRWGDVQLKNGLANYTASGRIWGYRGEGWYDNVVPVVPGQTRQYGGTMPANYPAKGGAPSQWQDAYNQTAGSQPSYPGGPGFVVGSELYNPGSGG